jgi:N-methylhydantoinase B/oxoprolinase/acetone carboxylase alpha subunit
MTNTRNTPIEALEHSFPLHMEEYSVRRGSGGAGASSGGDGVVRAVRVLEDSHVDIVAQRRIGAPAGRNGGSDGAVGRQFIDGSELPGVHAADIPAGTVIRIETPGGGGWGTPTIRG